MVTYFLCFDQRKKRRETERQRQAEAKKEEGKRVKERGGEWKEGEGKKGRRRGKKGPNRPGTKILKQWLYPLLNIGFLGHLTGSANILCTYF